MSIHWPDKYHPGRSTVHVSNSLSVTVKPEDLWAWMIRAPLWPTWYPNSSNMVFLNSDPPRPRNGNQIPLENFRRDHRIRSAGVRAFPALGVECRRHGCRCLSCVAFPASSGRLQHTHRGNPERVPREVRQRGDAESDAQISSDLVGMSARSCAGRSASITETAFRSDDLLHMSVKKKNRWVKNVTTDSTHPPEGLFTKDAATIARSLASKRSRPKDRARECGC